MSPGNTDVVVDAENTIEPDSRATPPPASLASSSTSAAPDVDTDDGYDTESVSGDSTSLASNVRDYIFENNRRYHKYKEGRYLIPNDDPEQEREDMKHAMIVHLCGGKLHFAPLDDPQEILDIGTGTGIWAIDMADEYPSAKVVGVDLSPIQPAWTPPNAQFYVDDAEEDWVNGDDTLDYVHARHMSPAIKDWEKVMRQAYRSLKPGGWIELQDILLQTQCDDTTMPADYKLSEFMDNLHKGFGAFNVNLRAFENFETLLEAAGFINITSRVWKVPIGTWPLDKEMKKIGLYNRCVIYDALQNVSLGPFTRGLGWSANQVEVFLVDVRKQMMDASIHSYYTFHVFYAQKPTH